VTRSTGKGSTGSTGGIRKIRQKLRLYLKLLVGFVLELHRVLVKSWILFSVQAIVLEIKANGKAVKLADFYRKQREN